MNSINDDWNIAGVKPERPKPQTPKRIFNIPVPQNKTTPQLRARRLLTMLQEDHRFDLIGEIVKTYNEIQDLEDDIERIKLARSVQKDLMKYAFPILKAQEGMADKPAINLNFNISDSDRRATMKNISPKPIKGGTIDAEFIEDYDDD